MPNIHATAVFGGQAVSTDKHWGETPPISIAYVQQLRRECRVWRLRLADAEKEIGRLRIAVILAENGAARPVRGGA